MKQKSIVQKIFEEVRDNGSHEITLRSYSGRGMYRKECLGVVCERITDWLPDFVQICIDEGAEEEYGDVSFELSKMQQDSMGLSTIFYFPSVPYIED